MPTIDYVFPVSCQNCRSMEGMPFRVATIADGSVRVYLRCRLCRYEWEIELAGDSVAIGPKPDRRSD